MNKPVEERHTKAKCKKTGTYYVWHKTKLNPGEKPKPPMILLWDIEYKDQVRGFLLKPYFDKTRKTSGYMVKWNWRGNMQDMKTFV